MEDSVFATVALPIALAVIMTVLGLALTPADFRRVVVFPRGVAIGLSNLIVISPLLAFAVAEAFALDPALAVGLVILGAAPGGTMANMLTHLARGDTALSITLTAISSVAAVITVPLYLELATNHFGAGGFDDDVGMGGVVARVLLITVIPLSLGMYIRSRSPERVAAIEPRAKAVALGLFLLVVIGAVISEYERVFENLDDVAAAAVTLNVAAMALAFAISRVARLDDRQSTAIAIELGIHNATLAIAVAATISTVLTIPAAVYSAFMFITAGLFARAMYKRNTAAAEATAAEAEAAA
ncbi:MAG TPA: bile acid:sodium symporter family protein [Solirubrobacterales bacterium]|nr:bile acid:sodium symporter family protein [Solirubrobacterales bacterium]